jgi:hypothetical protein
MKLTAIILASYFTSSLAAPASRHATRRAVVEDPHTLPLDYHPVLIRSSHHQKRAGPVRAAATAAAAPAALAAPPAKAAAVGGACAAPEAAGAAEAAAATGAGEAADAEENEVEIEAAFGEEVALQGGDLKQDVLYPPSVSVISQNWVMRVANLVMKAIGLFEVEFQGAEARSVVVTENKTPAAPPAGFAAIEPSSYKVQIGGGATAGLTLQKIDYIFDANSKVSPLPHMK